MNDPVTDIANRIDALQSTLEHPQLEADLTLGFYAEARGSETLADRAETAIRDIARDEGRAVVTIDLGGVLETDEGLRCWGTVTLAAVGVTA